MLQNDNQFDSKKDETGYRVVVRRALEILPSNRIQLSFWFLSNM